MKGTVSRAGRLLLILVGVLALALGAAACSEESGDTTSGSANSARPSVDPSGNITIVAKDNSFAPNDFIAKANQKTMVMMNNTGAAIHNFVIQGQKGPDGKDIGTELINGGKQGMVEFTLPAGTYDFICTVHPAEMTGKLTVQ